MKFIITGESKQRLDTFLSQKLQVSKNQINHTIKNGLVLHNGSICLKNGKELKEGDCIEMLRPQKEQKTKPQWKGEEIAVLYEDEDVLVLNKPPRLVVHNAPSVQDPTLVEYLQNKGYSLSTLSGEERYGIIHRLDKPTSGAIAVAKSDKAHIALSHQLQSREMGRYYLAVIDLPLKEKIDVQCKMGRNPANRLKMAKLQNGRDSKTTFYPLLSQKYGLVCAKLHTGRTHQIRLHLETLSRHILGDELYGKKDSLSLRLMLHAYLMYFIHPLSGEKILLQAPLFRDMLEVLENNFSMEEVNEVLTQEHILRCFGDCF